MKIFRSSDCNSVGWYSRDNTKVATPPPNWLQIKPDYEGLDCAREQEQKAIHFYCNVITNPAFLPNPESYLVEWIREIEIRGLENCPEYELEVLRRLRNIFKV